MIAFVEKIAGITLWCTLRRRSTAPVDRWAETYGRAGDADRSADPTELNATLRAILCEFACLGGQSPAAGPNADRAKPTKRSLTIDTLPLFSLSSRCGRKWIESDQSGSLRTIYPSYSAFLTSSAQRPAADRWPWLPPQQAGSCSKIPPTVQKRGNGSAVR